MGWVETSCSFPWDCWMSLTFRRLSESIWKIHAYCPNQVSGCWMATAARWYSKPWLVEHRLSRELALVVTLFPGGGVNPEEPCAKGPRQAWAHLEVSCPKFGHTGHAKHSCQTMYNQRNYLVKAHLATGPACKPSQLYEISEVSSTKEQWSCIALSAISKSLSVTCIP